VVLGAVGQEFELLVIHYEHAGRADVSAAVSCLLGDFLGMHYPESRFYLRRVRLSSDADVLGPLRDAGYR